MIYLDNGATTNVKPINVKRIVKKSMQKSYSVNPNRSGYKISSIVASKIFNIRESLASYFGADNFENVIFTSGCTEALNLAILSSFQIGGNVITTSYEHNSVLRPLFKLKEEGKITLTIIYPNKNGEISYKDFEKEIKPNTYMVACNFTSNVTGYSNDIEKIGKLCKKHNLLFLVDGAQACGHEKIDIQKLNIDFLSVAGHKGFYSATGIGALVISNVGKKFLKPIKYGGTGTKSSSPVQPSDFPDGFESGTPNVTGILSLGEGLNFVKKNQNKINNKIFKLTNYLVDKLKNIKDIKIYPTNNLNSGVISFNIKNFSSNDVGNFLSEKFGICVRCGLHCAPLVHKFYNTLGEGMVRISLSYFNNKKDINKLIYALKNFTNQV